jgi:hypothetical protein
MDTTAIAVAVPILTTGEIADINYVGFHKQDANTTTFDTTYRADTVAAVVVGEAEATGLTAATWMKVGMKFNSDDKVLRFYVNGVELTSTKTIVNALGTTFPSDVVLGPVIALMVGAGASDNTLDVDWFRIAQVI